MVSSGAISQTRLKIICQRTHGRNLHTITLLYKIYGAGVYKVIYSKSLDYESDVLLEMERQLNCISFMSRNGYIA